MTNSSISEQHTEDSPISDSNATKPSPLRIENITSSADHITEFWTHCPKCCSALVVIASGEKPGQTQPPDEGRAETSESQRWTTEKLIDKLFLHLVSITEYILDESGETIEVKKYYRQATEKIRRIPVGRPSPEFIVQRSDLTGRLRNEIENATSVGWQQYVLKSAAERIFENIDFDYYHLSVARFLKVRLVA
jgi:hypothetical protein